MGMSAHPIQQPIAMEPDSLNQDAPVEGSEGEHPHVNAMPVDSQGQHNHQHAAPKDSHAVHHPQGANICSDTILATVCRIGDSFDNNGPLSDLSGFTTNGFTTNGSNMSLSLSFSLSTEQYSNLQVTLLLNPKSFETCFAKSHLDAKSRTMRKALPPCMKEQDNAPSPAFLYGCLFFIACEDFSWRIHQFF